MLLPRGEVIANRAKRIQVAPRLDAPRAVSTAVRRGGDGSAMARHIMVIATASVAVSMATRGSSTRCEPLRVRVAPIRAKKAPMVNVTPTSSACNPREDHTPRRVKSHAMMPVAVAPRCAAMLSCANAAATGRPGSSRTSPSTRKGMKPKARMAFHSPKMPSRCWNSSRPDSEAIALEAEGATSRCERVPGIVFRRVYRAIG